jgi:2-keto-4-pentenoate hydratase/2-oxohepta-3-ene-1,7-dioic acid hydratase in catechol pathway
MKLCRYGPRGSERPGIIDADGVLRDISHLVEDINPDVLAPERLNALSAANSSSFPAVAGNVRFGVPWTGISKFIGIGLNFSDHAREAGLETPAEPIIFLKAPSAICGPNDDTVIPPGSSKLDWEVELGVVIGSEARNIAKADAASHIAGYCLVNDVSERAFQLQSSQWDKGKGCDTFGPIGPWLVTGDEIVDPANLGMWLDVNGQRMQNSRTSQMIFDVPTLVSYVSRFMTLLPGDVIATGTPAGVGMGQKPEPIWLRAGDVVELAIDGLGRQRQTVITG